MEACPPCAGSNHTAPHGIRRWTPSGLQLPDHKRVSIGAPIHRIVKQATIKALVCLTLPEISSLQTVLLEVCCLLGIGPYRLLCDQLLHVYIDGVTGSANGRVAGQPWFDSASQEHLPATGEGDERKRKRGFCISSLIGHLAAMQPHIAKSRDFPHQRPHVREYRTGGGSSILSTTSRYQRCMESHAGKLYEERVLAAASRPIAELPKELSQSLQNRIVALEWRKGNSAGTLSAATHVNDVGTSPTCDLRILLAPLDLPEIPEAYPGFAKLVALYNIPDKFLSERIKDVAFAFGSQIEDGYKVTLQVLWMHLLFKDIPPVKNSEDMQESGWARTSFFLRWHIASSESKRSLVGTSTGAQVTMICFGAVKPFRDRCKVMQHSTDWEKILDHPEVLVGYFLDSWHDRVNRVVWTAHDRGRDLESETLDATSNADIERPRSELRLRDLYRLIQTVLWLREGLEATMRASELFTEDYRESISFREPSIAQKNLMADFIYGREAFRALLFRLISLQHRLENINNIMYSVASRRENRLMYRSSEDMRNISRAVSKDSNMMAILATLGIMFLPTTVVAAVISAVLDGQVYVGSVLKLLGILLGISIPLTIGLILLLYDKLPRRRRYW